jgi:hypothetical protein
MYFAYAAFQAEQPKSVAEQRADDQRRGELALAISQLLHHGRATAATASPVPQQSRTVRHHAHHYA